MPTEINGETYLSTSEAANMLRVSRQTLDTLVRDGRLKRYKQGIRKTHYYKHADLAALLELREDQGDS